MPDDDDDDEDDLEDEYIYDDYPGMLCSFISMETGRP